MGRLRRRIREWIRGSVTDARGTPREVAPAFYNEIRDEPGMPGKWTGLLVMLGSFLLGGVLAFIAVNVVFGGGRQLVNNLGPVLGSALLAGVQSVIMAVVAFGPIVLYARWQRGKLFDFAVRTGVRRRLCPGCVYDLSATPPEPEGCVVCPECGAAWKTPEDRDAPQDAYRPGR